MPDASLIYGMIAIVALIIFYVWLQGAQSRRLKRIGIKARGVIIENNEKQRSQPVSEQLGGNINEPVVRFTIEDGSEIVGRPVTGFISQYEIQVPSYIDIIYDPNNPSIFIIDPD
jgi:hypothetical protein